MSNQTAMLQYLMAHPPYTVSTPVITCTDNTVYINAAFRTINIHYTTDGTTPSMTSPMYREPFEINRDTTVKAIAAKPGYYHSEVASLFCEYVDEFQYEES